MVMSMTGFGRARIEEDGKEIAIEIKTLNHRYLDISIKTPRNLSFLEEEFRKIIQQNLTRGRVEVYVSSTAPLSNFQKVEINKPLLSSYVASFHELENEYGFKNDVGISTLLGIPDLFVLSEPPQDEEALKVPYLRALQAALDDLKAMREKEGTKLKADLLERLDLITDITRKIEEKAPLVVEEYRKKLRTRLQELLQGTDLDEGRFKTEVAYFADRSNITEEIVRLYSHLEQFKESLNTGNSIGRKLDFLVQEMNREANTIGSKASDLSITNLIVEIKSEIEKIREQIQNIE